MLDGERIAGIACIAAGVLANPVVLGLLFAPDGSIDGEARVRMIYLFDLLKPVDSTVPAETIVETFTGARFVPPAPPPTIVFKE